jgi:hypothetical protein
MQRRLVLVVWLLGLLLSQTLGMLHGIAHAPISASYAGSAPMPGLSVDHIQRGAEGLTKEIFDGHGGSSDTAECRLYDQCSHVDTLVPLPALCLPLVPPSFVLLGLAGLATARWHAQFQARGPPLVR